MALNSYGFILAFLPLAVLSWFLLNRRGWFQMANAAVLLFSLLFCGLSGPHSLVYIIGSLVFNYAVSRHLVRESQTAKKRRRWLAGAIAANVLLLAFTKYTNFVLGTGARLLGQPFDALNILVPLGISFITFQQIAYLVDSYRGETRGYRFLEYAVFITWFPKIISGPIVLHGEMLPQLQDPERRRFSFDHFAAGLHDFAIGLVKKVILAELFAGAVTWGFSSANLGSLSAPEALIVMLAYTFQIYFDFSGYTDMALGVSRLLNIELPPNFNSPYRALSVGDFWKRWHISLTSFLRKYIYIPLGGSRRDEIRTMANILIIFLISGLWHGASLTFLVWGALHGLASILHRRFSTAWSRMYKGVQWFLTFLFVNLSWVVFRAESPGSALTFYRRLFSFRQFTISPELTRSFLNFELRYAERLMRKIPMAGAALGGTSPVIMLIVLGLTLVLVLNAKNTQETVNKTSPMRAVSTAVFLVWSLLSLSGITAYIYAGF